MLKAKRIYDSRSEDDGFRILVDRLWPRGVSKEKAKVDLWLKDIAPSDELRKWFAHDETRWDELNSPAQTWVRRWFTAYCKETLARVRGKYSGNLKTPDSELTLEYTTLQSEAKDEKTILWEELKTRLERLRPEKQWEIKGAMAENMNKSLKYRPFTSPYNVI